MDLNPIMEELLMVKTAKKTRKAREVPVVSGRIRLSENGRAAMEKILIFRGMRGEPIRDLTTSQVLDDALSFHAQALAGNCAKERATA